MTAQNHNPTSPNSYRLSRQGFQPLDSGSNNDTMGTNPADNIPLQTVVSTSPSYTATAKGEQPSEKTGIFQRGRRRLQKTESNGDQDAAAAALKPQEEEGTALNRMGRFYLMVLNFSIVTRYLLYVAPLALALAVPIILAVTGVIGGTISGANPKYFFIWLEIVWLSFWGCKIIAHFLPVIFEVLVGVVSPGVKKYVQLIGALEKPLSFVFWMIVNQVTFQVLIIHNRKRAEPWQSKLGAVLLALLVCTCIVLAERLLIQLISISYHRKQFDGKIKESKRNIYLLGQMYDASRALFPNYCNEFAEEDYIIQDQLSFTLGSKTPTVGPPHNRSGSKTPMRLMANVGRMGDKVTSAFGTVAQEITGKKVFDPNSAHSIVLEALEHNKSAEALARRIWLSFVVEGKNALFREDLVEVMGPARQQEAEECFGSLDRDGNGDISLEEMILTVTEIGRERKSISSSMHDVDQAINALDALLAVIVFVICIFVIVCFLSPSFTTTLATSATALLSLSFVFAATCQEVLGSCIFLFVKHPYDIGDRVDIATDQLTVEHISLLYTVFKRVTNGKIVQTPNIVLNNLWIENITRSKAMREQVSIFAAFDTSFEDVNALKQEMTMFVRDAQNSRDFHSDIEIEVVGIAEMNKLELRAEIRHKSNWSNESLRAARRSKFMCALVLALRKVPINPPGGSDVGLGDANKPTWSVAISPEEAAAARQKFLDGKDASRLNPTKKPTQEDTGVSTGTDYLGGGAETHAMHTLNSRKPGVDTIRDDTWTARDDASTIGRPSTDARPELDDIRGMLHKANNGGRRKQNDTLSPTSSHAQVPTLQAISSSPAPTNPYPSSGTMYAPPPQQMQSQSGSALNRSLSTRSNNPYRAAAPYEQHPYRP